jgi:hypothetical protein
MHELLQHLSAQGRVCRRQLHRLRSPTPLGPRLRLRVTRETLGAAPRAPRGSQLIVGGRPQLADRAPRVPLEQQGAGPLLQACGDLLNEMKMKMNEMEMEMNEMKMNEMKMNEMNMNEMKMNEMKMNEINEHE